MQNKDEYPDCSLTGLKLKPFLTNSQLIQHLKSSGLIIDNEVECLQIIKNIGFFKLINGYRTPFRELNYDTNQFQYKDNTNFDEIYALYNFDLELRQLTSKYIYKIELQFKNLISETFSKYGTNHNLYLQDNYFNFKFDKSSGELLKNKLFLEIEKEVNYIIEKYTNSNGEVILNNSIIHYYKNYEGIPLWVIFNILSFGKIPMFYECMLDNDQVEISKNFKVYPTHIISFLYHLSHFRNVCAHNERLYCFRTHNLLQLKPFYTKLNLLNLPKNNLGLFTVGTKDYFSLIIVFKVLLNEDDFYSFFNSIISLLNELKSKLDETDYANITKTMGLVSDWAKLLDISFK